MSTPSPGASGSGVAPPRPPARRAGVGGGPICLGICSPMPGSGKSTVAEHLERQHRFRIVSFAQPLRRVVATLLTEAGYSGIEAWRYVTEAKHHPLELLPGTPTARRLLQLTGTELGRNFIHPDLWVDLWQRQAARLLSAGYSVVVDDVRFPNEAAAVRALGGKALYLERPGLEVNPAVLAHSSEGGIAREATDRVLINGGTIEELLAQVDELLAWWREEQEVAA